MDYLVCWYMIDREDENVENEWGGIKRSDDNGCDKIIRA